MLRLLVAALALAALTPALAPAPAAAFLAPATPELDGALPAGTVSTGAEPMVLVAQSGAILVADTSGLRRSVDGGLTWTRSANPFSVGGAFTDGWALAQDAAGTLYVAKTQGQVISVAASDDDGRSFRSVSVLVGAGPVADRPWLAAGAAGHVALVWYQAGAGEWCAASTDGGLTWLGRTTNNVGFSNAGNLHMDADGSLWYAEDYGIHRWDAGCAGPVRTATLPLSGPQIFTQLARTPSGDGFVAQPSTDGRMELRGIHGLDKTSMKRLVVSPPEHSTTTFGAVAALGDDEVAVAWYGTEAAGNPSSSAFRGDWNVYVARVTGYWTSTPTITVTKVTDTPNHKGWFCMSGVTCSTGRALLDYFGIAYDAEGGLHVAYGHDVGGVQVRHAVVPAGP